MKPLRVLHENTDTEEQTVDIKYYKDVSAVIASVGGKKVGALRVKPYQDGYQVDSVIVNPDYRNFGIGKEMYRTAFESLKTLYSDKYQTPDAKRVWDSLIKTGEATREGQRYKMIKALEESISLTGILKELIDDPVQPGILKDRLGKLTCTKVRTAHSALGNKGTHYGKALQRYLNYHCQ